jgi:uncharacterized protein (DUF1919 family)
MGALPRQWRLRRQVKRRDFTVISCNCWGAEIYRDLRTPYRTPFVGMYILPDDYLHLLENFSQLMSQPLEFTVPGRVGTGPSYPVGLLDGRIHIHFVHYRAEAEVRMMWERRCGRMVQDLNRTFFMFCDRDGCTREHLERFDHLPFRHKVAFVARPAPDVRSAVVVPHPNPLVDYVEEGPPLYRRCQRIFPVADWLNAD